MKLKQKINGIYMISVFLSVTIFLLFCYYILHAGYYSGISSSDMQTAVADGADDLWTMNSEELVSSLNEKYKGMEFAVWSREGFTAKEGLPVIENETDLLDGMNGCLQKSEGYYITASGRAGVLENGTEETRYLICYVPKTEFEAMSYSFNFSRGRGLLGKIAIVGAVITALIMEAFLFFFSRKLVGRFEDMYEAMEQFSANRLEIRMDAAGKDELAVMAEAFNSMADKIEKQYKEKEFEEAKKRELISDISHDLRTPLASIMGYSEMLENGIYTNEEERREYDEIIHRKAVYMEKLLTELLAYSRLEMGTFAIHKKTMDLTECLREILSEYYREFEKKECKLKLTIPDNAVLGEWDEEHLGRVIRNLLDNALKYGMDGKRLDIILTENTEENADKNADKNVDKNADKKTVRLVIKDYGKGLSKEMLSHATERFYRADAGRNSNAGGMGLGLYMAEETIRLHGGKLILESAPEEGFEAQIVLYAGV